MFQNEAKIKLNPESTKKKIKLIKMRREGEAKKVWSPSLHMQAPDHSLCILCWVLPIYSNYDTPHPPSIKIWEK